MSYQVYDCIIAISKPSCSSDLNTLLLDYAHLISSSLSAPPHPYSSVSTCVLVSWRGFTSSLLYSHHPHFAPGWARLHHLPANRSVQAVPCLHLFPLHAALVPSGGRRILPTRLTRIQHIYWVQSPLPLAHACIHVTDKWEKIWR